MGYRFLIVKTSAIGDVIQAFPIAEYLKEKHAGCSIDWVVERQFSSLLETHPLVDRLILADTRAWRSNPRSWAGFFTFRQQLRQQTYDVLFDLQGNIKSGLITAFAKAKEKVGFSWRSLREKPSWLFSSKHIDVDHEANVQKRYLSLVQKFFQDTDPFLPRGTMLRLSGNEKERLQECLRQDKQLPVMVAFGSKWKNKQLPLPLLTRFLELLTEKENPFFYFVWGNDTERLIAESLQQQFPSSMAVGNLSFPLWQALMAQMQCVLAMDSAALHLCATTGTPTLSFFGPSEATVYKPSGTQHRHLQGTCPYGKKFEQRCPLLRTCPTGACMQSFTPEQMLEEFQVITSWNSFRKGLKGYIC